MAENLIYTGLKVQIKEPNHLTGSVKADYDRDGFTFVKSISDSERVMVSSGGGCNSIRVTQLIPIYDSDILTVLESKERELKALEKEIENIRNFINTTCKNA